MSALSIEPDRDTILWTTWRLHATIPSILARGETFSLRLTAYGPENLPVHFDRDIEVVESVGVEGLPRVLRFDPAEGGLLTVEGLRATDGGRAGVALLPEGCPRAVPANPAWILDDPPYRLYWGDLHMHTKHSNCSPWACQDPEFGYVYARDASHLDFLAAADHTRGLVSEDSRWPRQQGLVKSYDAPGRFVPFLAYESSHKSGFGGDNNVYFLGSEGPIFWPDREDMGGWNPEVPLEDLWAFLDASGVEYFTAPHHSGRAGKYRSFADPTYSPEREPVFEIFSLWGSSERRLTRAPILCGNAEGPCYFVDALRAGCRYGLIASSDDHRTLPGGESKGRLPMDLNRLGSYLHHGLAAVHAPELTREALWRSLWRRDCYATTMERTLLDARLGDLSMGQAAQLGASDSLRKRREVRVRALGTMAEAEVTLVRNGEDIETQRWTPDAPELVFVDEAPLEDVALRDAQFHPDPFVVYYVRMSERFDQTQWTSPIWLDM